VNPVCPADGAGSLPGMFVWTKRSGQRGRARFSWWPLLLSLALSVLLTVIVNAAIR
jgi:hypothetical protein